MKYLKDFINLVKNVRQLEKDVENLENKLLAPEEVKRNDFWGLSILQRYYSGGFSSKNISLEEKVDAIIKALKIKFERTEEKDSEVVAKLPKKK